jgi:hypothetical protein
MFIVFGLVALYFGQRLALGTPIRMGPGYVPRMLSLILLCLGSLIVMIALWRTAEKSEKERWWLPVGGLSALVVAVACIPWGANLIGGMLPAGIAKAGFTSMPIPVTVAVVLVFDCLVLMVAAAVFRADPPEDDQVEKPAWKPITMVTIGVVCFGLLFEPISFIPTYFGGLFPALTVLILIASLGGEEFKINEVVGNIVVLAVLCTAVFKVGLGMNIYVLRLAGW